MINAWDKYTWAHSKLAFDRTGGQLKTLIDEMSLIPKEKQASYINDSLQYAINQLYHSIKCLRDRHDLAHRLEAAEGIKPFLQALFCLHDRRPAPFYKYLKWELEHYPLEKLSLSSEELISAITSILGSGDYQAQQMLYKKTEPLFLSKGYDSAFKEWNKGYEWALHFKPKHL